MVTLLDSTRTWYIIIIYLFIYLLRRSSRTENKNAHYNTQKESIKINTSSKGKVR